MSPPRPAETKPYFLAFLAILALKLALLALSGPILAPDTAGYRAYSDVMLAGTAWLHDAGISAQPMPTTAFRMPGYPALIAAARLVAGGFWGWLLALLQIALSLVALFRLTCLRDKLGLSPAAMLFVLAAIATSSSLVLDAALLSDSFHASLVMLAVTGLLLAALEERPMGAASALGAGLLLAAAFLLREALIYLWLPLLPLLVLAAGSRRRLAVAALTLLPLAATITACNAWNKQRTGVAFVTTGSQTALLVPLLAAAAREPAIFAGDTPLDQAARQSNGRADFATVLDINERLFASWHLTAPEIAAAAYRHYFASWRAHPAAMARAVLAGLRLNQVFLLFRPLDALREYRLWATGQPSQLGRWKELLADWRTWPLYLVTVLSRTISSAIFAAFLLVTPWRAWREGRRSAPARAGVAVWLLYLGWYAIYAMVHVETRYMAPVLPFAVLFGVANLRWLWRRRGEGGGAFTGDTA